MTDLVRTQVMLEKRQYETLSLLAQREGCSLSALVRVAVDAQIRRQRYLELQQAAALLRADYAAYGAITDLMILDGLEADGPEEHSNAPG